jgi:hypothetical protein
MRYAPAFRPALGHENSRKRLSSFGYSLEFTNSEGAYGHSFSL